MSLYVLSGVAYGIVDFVGGECSNEGGLGHNMRTSGVLRLGESVADSRCCRCQNDRRRRLSSVLSNRGGCDDWGNGIFRRAECLGRRERRERLENGVDRRRTDRCSCGGHTRGKHGRQGECDDVADHIVWILRRLGRSGSLDESDGGKTAVCQCAKIQPFISLISQFLLQQSRPRPRYFKQLRGDRTS